MDINEIIGQAWPGWRIVEKLGEGSFGSVYHVVRKDLVAETHSAIKVIHIPQDPNEVRRLKSQGMSIKEVQTILEHRVRDLGAEIRLMEMVKSCPNIVTIDDYTVMKLPDAPQYLVMIRMELLTPLLSLMEKRPLSEGEGLQLGLDLCDALIACQENNIVHRDIKPENIFMDGGGTFKLGDFGVARTMERMTTSFTRTGTYDYMAPEIYNGAIDHIGIDDAQLVDIYSLGMVLYVLLNGGRSPFVSLDDIASGSNANRGLIDRMSGKPLPPPANASQGMSEIILKACAFRPRDRYANAGALRRDLERLLEKKPELRIHRKDIVQRLLREKGFQREMIRIDRPNSAQRQFDRDSGRQKRPSQKGSGPKTNPKKGRKRKHDSRMGLLIALMAGILCAGLVVFFLVLPRIQDSTGASDVLTVTMSPVSRTESPAANSTLVPTAVPTSTPTAVPTAALTAVPTAAPSVVPTAVPSAAPTVVPTATPTTVPTAAPSVVTTFIADTALNPESAPIPYAFQEASIEKAVRKALNKGVNESVYIEELSHIESLALSSMGITDISDVGYCTGLVHLSMRNNAIHDLTPLSGLTKLKKLWLQDNQIIDLTPLKGLTQLVFLNLSNNEITDIAPLEKLINLEELWLEGNDGIRDTTPLAGLEKLWIYKGPDMIRSAASAPQDTVNTPDADTEMPSPIRMTSPEPTASNLTYAMIPESAPMVDPKELAVVPFGESYTFDAQITKDGEARYRIEEGEPFETLRFTLSVKESLLPSDYASRWGAAYKLKGTEAGVGFDLTLADYTGTTPIIPQNILTVILQSESGQTRNSGYQLMDAEINGQISVDIRSGATKTFWKRYAFSNTGEPMAYLSVSACVDGAVQTVLFELPPEDAPTPVPTSAAEPTPAPSPKVLAVVPFGESYSFDAQITRDGVARYRIEEGVPFETLHFTLTVKESPLPSDYASRWGTAYKLKGTEAGVGFDLTLADYTGTTPIIPQNILTVILQSESGQTRNSGYQLMDAEINGQTDVEIHSGATKTFWKRYAFSNSGEPMAYLSVSACVDGAVQTVLFELQSNVPPTPDPQSLYTTLAIGDKSDAVLDLQKRLIELGYFSGLADGVFGLKTESAVKHAQTVYGMEANGMATPDFQAKLFAEDN